jgi:hypothetical protein
MEDHCEDIDVDGRIILKTPYRNKSVRVWNIFNGF